MEVGENLHEGLDNDVLNLHDKSSGLDLKQQEEIASRLKLEQGRVEEGEKRAESGKPKVQQPVGSNKPCYGLKKCACKCDSLTKSLECKCTKDDKGEDQLCSCDAIEGVDDPGSPNRPGAVPGSKDFVYNPIPPNTKEHGDPTQKPEKPGETGEPVEDPHIDRAGAGPYVLHP